MLLLGLRDHLRIVGELPFCSLGNLGLLLGHPDHLVSRTASCLHVWRPMLLLGLRDYLRIVGELPFCSLGNLGFSLATLIINSKLESALLARMVTYASSWPPWSSTNCRRAPVLLVRQPGLLLGHPDHQQLVGERPACTFGDLCFFLASVIIYELSESSRFAR